MEFPRNFRDRRAKKLIETLLNMNPEARYNGSYSNLKSNPWFESIVWVLLLLDRMTFTTSWCVLLTILRVCVT